MELINFNTLTQKQKLEFIKDILFDDSYSYLVEDVAKFKTDWDNLHQRVDSEKDVYHNYTKTAHIFSRGEFLDDFLLNDEYAETIDIWGNYDLKSVWEYLKTMYIEVKNNPINNEIDFIYEADYSERLQLLTIIKTEFIKRER